jgi:Lar family restriction alleviation protein
MSDQEPMAMLSCPFCGGDAYVAAKVFESRPDETIFWAVCRSCACEGPWGKSEASARAAWNRRDVGVRALLKERDDLKAEVARLTRQGDVGIDAWADRADAAEAACAEVVAVLRKILGSMTWGEGVKISDAPVDKRGHGVWESASGNAPEAFFEARALLSKHEKKGGEG